MFQQVTLIGRLGDDPEIKKVKTPAGERAVSVFTVAVNERWVDDAGAKQEPCPEWNRRDIEWFTVCFIQVTLPKTRHSAEGR